MAAVGTTALTGLASIAAGGNDTAVAVDFTDGSRDRILQLTGNNDGTPASGDVLNVYALYSNDETPSTYDTTGGAAFLGKIDTNVQDPLTKTFPLRAGVTSVEIYITNESAGRAITPSGQISEVVD